MTVLVTAANGNQGKLLIPRLVAAGVALRACVRSDESARTLRAAGVPDVVVGDISDPAVLSQAIGGVEKVYYIGPALHPKEREMGFAVIDAARVAGVQHFVFSSVLHAITTDLIQHEIKRDLEEYLLSSGLEFTILQPANYMLSHRLGPAFENGVFRLSWALDRYQSMVDLGDVTEVAAAVLADSDHHAGATYELVAPGRYTAHDLARVISEVVGREIVAEQIDSDVFLRAALGTDDLSQFPYEARLLRAISKRYSSHDFIGNPNVLSWLLGRQPTTWERFVQREFDTLRPPAENHR
ncbi:MAG: NmrA family NAD(P)-binding protein [Candidatus Dormibacteraeota bacterium]|uniref:NmrA family NAD(P)-binding protein n=1 Tax=Candidatus Dormiibacter inghamiae TaxID=3127013 RepID=A0A934KH62_9BACT|nr:NmrA family NAD(P)-binding protein [Candidatus Dormibacteraeota bacterium]MBJ7605215.1 NmrA family NAD(P)-binding protein [Candidatus Dormibacteraeota bacterium]